MTNEPQVKFQGFTLWITSYQFPDASDYWDANWLNARARFATHGARVEAQGAFLQTTDIASFAKSLETLRDTLIGNAELSPLDPELRLEIKGDHLGRLACTLLLTPDHMNQKHEFRFDLDQTYLTPLIEGCKRILAEFPVRNDGGR